jgi:hypothetical protein
MTNYDKEMDVIKEHADEIWDLACEITKACADKHRPIVINALAEVLSEFVIDCIKVECHSEALNKFIAFVLARIEFKTKTHNENHHEASSSLH